ncbi:hypothetical protein SAMN00777080_3812 [Aquiflexum balticum DSM 16537]|uniref:Uncharacterized protein n=1 Tax=Aquiflexum balticum DSM 16537 TaxID=758820 RepID=A0A1W2H8G7_9BACT|nr:hypothetical protein [Aquiflexum balticum]SMD45167.1 hypothetical protein SAMN00777080_3812 [Aquiflexum balticum DSM 16537]
MKKSISICLVFISGICFSAFSQDISPNPKKDFEWKSLEELPWYHGIPRLNQKDSIIILSPELEGSLNFPGLDGQKFSFKNDTDKSFPVNLPTIYNMPIHKPEGEFPILVHVPDENVNYTIRINKY